MPRTDVAVDNFILSTLCPGESPKVSPLEAERIPPPGLAPLCREGFQEAQTESSDQSRAFLKEGRLLKQPA